MMIRAQGHGISVGRRAAPITLPWRLGMLLVVAHAAWAAPETDVPVAPIAPAPALGWEAALALGTSPSRAVVIPDTGRVAEWSLAGEENVFYRAEQWSGRRPGDPSAGQNWINFGGWSLWPVPTSSWELLQSAGWRPSRVVDGAPWTGRGWVAADQAPTARLEREWAAPIHLSARRTVRLDPERAILQVEDRLTRVADCDVPVALWGLLQIVRPTRVIVPRDAQTGVEKAFESRGGRMSYAALHPTEHALVFTLDSKSRMDVHATSDRSWLAFEIGRQLLVVRGPAGGPRLRLYLDSGQPRAEIECLPAAAKLGKGETLSHAIELRLGRVRPDASAAYIARQARRLAGEEAPVDSNGSPTSDEAE